MKKIIPLIIVLVIAIGVFAFSISFSEKRNSIITSTTEPSDSVTPYDPNLYESDIIARNDEAGYKLYYKNDVVTVVYKDELELVFANWKNSIDLGEPELYYNDFDNDGEKDFIVRIIDGYSDVTGETIYSYSLYMFTPVTDDDGNTELKYSVAKASNWQSVFKSAIKSEVTQLNECKKYIQFAMNDHNKTINYDEKTGITDNEYVGYARTDCNTKKQYYTVDKYNRGIGIYTIKDNGKITLDIQVLVTYKESSYSYYIGDIHCDMHIKNRKFGIMPNTIEFIPRDEYRITDPRDVAEENWSYTITNISDTNSEINVIKDIHAKLDIIGSYTSDEYRFANYTGGVKNIDKIEFTQGDVTISAKSGYSFDNEQIENGKFEIIIADDQDISYTAEIIDNKLIIHFDKTYDKEDLSSVEISFGL